MWPRHGPVARGDDPRENRAFGGFPRSTRAWHVSVIDRSATRRPMFADLGQARRLAHGQTFTTSPPNALPSHPAPESTIWSPRQGLDRGVDGMITPSWVQACPKLRSRTCGACGSQARKTRSDKTRKDGLVAAPADSGFPGDAATRFAGSGMNAEMLRCAEQAVGAGHVSNLCNTTCTSSLSA